MSLEDVDRKIRLARVKVNELKGNTHMEFVIKSQTKTVLDILEDIARILEDQSRAMASMPQSS